jgi:hypothetical protein
VIETDGVSYDYGAQGGATPPGLLRFLADARKLAASC